MFIAMGALTRSGKIKTGERFARPRHPRDEKQMIFFSATLQCRSSG